MDDPTVWTPQCRTCLDVGWVLDTDPRRLPLVVNLAICPDECDLAGQAIEVLAVHGLFARAVLQNTTRAVMSLTGARPIQESAVPPATSRPAAGAPTRVPSPSPFPPGARTANPGDRR